MYVWGKGRGVRVESDRVRLFVGNRGSGQVKEEVTRGQFCDILTRGPRVPSYAIAHFMF